MRRFGRRPDGPRPDQLLFARLRVPGDGARSSIRVPRCLLNVIALAETVRTRQALSVRAERLRQVRPAVSESGRR
ncbi:MAG: hypothetical protein MZV64_42700 [Ignavibacteriales bacterium]|nr:hypothetical protein [Ignavibacteriales bacterium]